MCEHGEPNGPKYCALCRRANARQVITATPGELMTEALQAKELWVVQAELAVKQLVNTRQQFTADDLVNLVGLPRGVEVVNGNNAIGALFRKLSNQNVIRPIGWAKSARADNHGRQVRIWAGA